jgi:hypothetical protein
MAKKKVVVRSVSTKKAPAFDTMSVTVLLVMAIFGGLVGFYLGKGASSPQAVSLKEAAVMMKEKGMMMEDAGRIMEERGGKFNDKELMEKGRMMMEGGSVISGKGAGMMGMTQEY